MYVFWTEFGVFCQPNPGGMTHSYPRLEFLLCRFFGRPPAIIIQFRKRRLCWRIRKCGGGIFAVTISVCAILASLLIGYLRPALQCYIRSVTVAFPWRLHRQNCHVNTKHVANGPILTLYRAGLHKCYYILLCFFVWVAWVCLGSTQLQYRPFSPGNFPTHHHHNLVTLMQPTL